MLDAEVTALTNSSPGSSNGSTERKSSSNSSSKKAKLQDALLQQARKNLSEELSANQELRKISQHQTNNSTSGGQTTTTSSSGIDSRNSSQNNQTTSSSLSTGSSSALEASSSSAQQPALPPLLPVTTSGGLPLLSIDTTSGKAAATSAAAAAVAAAGLPPIPESSHTYVYYDNLPFYENWPPPKQFPPPVRPRLSLQQQQHAYLGYQFVPPPEAASAQLIPPLTPHQSQGQVARPQHPAAMSALGAPGFHPFGRPSSSADRAGPKNDSPGVADTSLDTPPSHAGGGAQGSRPGSAHSAPLLDLSIDRHYEFDAARTPTDDIGKEFMIMP